MLVFVKELEEILLGLGGWSIERKLYDWIITNCDSDSIFVEFGSGAGTEHLCKFFTKMYSIEENIKYVGLHNSNYIYAPIENNWYNLQFIDKLPEKIDIILIDGPAYGDRIGFYNNIDILMNFGPKILIFDDINRIDDMIAFMKTKEFLEDFYTKIEFEIITDDKSFGIIKITK